MKFTLCYNFIISREERRDMYNRGEQVLYGSHGVCLIIDIEVKSVDRKEITYYALEPLEQPGSRYYIPAHNKQLLQS